MHKRDFKMINENGKDVVLISVVNKRETKVALLYKEDFDSLLALGVSPYWCAPNDKQSNVLVAGVGKRKIGVARLLLDAGNGQIVKYKDGNPLNLKRENLELVANGRGKTRDRDLLPKAVELNVRDLVASAAL
jgi:hypothetical protein